ncbi:UNVERIFIED_CONTAM: hypothetical protein H355_005451, partial [Colinus virginianus]
LACVPDTWLHVAELTECYVSGWGVTHARSAQPAQTAEVLQEARVQLIDLERCNSTWWYGGAVHPHNLCAGYPQGGIDTCQTMANDIALLELDRPVWCSNYIQLACVPDTWLHVAELTECYVSGWGVTHARCEYTKRTAVPT